ncbi:hypothetical protein HYU93_01800 [Candidatus Daviesbacteria bacterium]|nr:hypothetical protein [Candidatus Daviesbacteria bacterium]
MPEFDLENSPLYESFEGLYIGDAVYSQNFGLGHIGGFYNDEIIVQFSNSRRRFSVEDEEIRKIPDDYFVGRSKKIKVNFEGKEMSYAEYKKMAGLTRKGKKEEKLKHITLKEALDILGITKSKLLKDISENNIQTKTFSRSVMIHRDDLLRLHKKIKKDKLR